MGDSAEVFRAMTAQRKKRAHTRERRNLADLDAAKRATPNLVVRTVGTLIRVSLNGYALDFWPSTGTVARNGGRRSPTETRKGQQGQVRGLLAWLAELDSPYKP